MGHNDKHRYQRSCAFSNRKRESATWNKRKDKTMNLDTQVNLAGKDKGSFYIQKKWWLVKCEYGKGINYSDYGDYKNCTSSEDKGGNLEESLSEEDDSSDSDMEELPTVYSCCAVFLFFPLFL